MMGGLGSMGSVAAVGAALLCFSVWRLMSLGMGAGRLAWAAAVVLFTCP